MKHLKDVNMTYIQHMLYAIKLSFELSILSYIALFHALMPCYCETFVSDRIKKLNKKLQDR